MLKRKIKQMVGDGRLMTSERTVQRLILVLILLGVLFRGFVLFSSDNWIEYSSASRLMAAMRIHEDPSISKNFNPTYGPLHPYLTALTIPFSSSDPSLGPRLLSLAFSVLLLWCFARFVALYFDSFTTVLATALAAFYPLHVLYSGFVMAEVPFHALLFACLYTYERYRRDPGRPVRFLILSALCFGASSITRFEGWIFIPLLILGLRQAPRRHLWGFGLGILCVPLWWCGMNWAFLGNPLGFLTGPMVEDHVDIARFRFYGEGAAALYANLWTKLTAWLRLVANGFSWPVAVAGLVGFAVSIVQLPKSRWPVLLLGWVWAFFTLKVITETWHVRDRDALILGLLLIPFAVEGLRFVARVFILRLRTAVVAMTALFIAYLGAQDALANRPLAPEPVREAGIWLREHASPKDHLILDRDQWDIYGLGIGLLSQRGVDQFYQIRTIRTSSERVVSEEALFEHVLLSQPRWLVYWPESFALASLFRFDPPNSVFEKFGDWEFQLRFYKEGEGEVGPVAIYEIFHPPWVDTRRARLLRLKNELAQSDMSPKLLASVKKTPTYFLWDSGLDPAPRSFLLPEVVGRPEVSSSTDIRGEPYPVAHKSPSQIPADATASIKALETFRSGLREELFKALGWPVTEGARNPPSAVLVARQDFDTFTLEKLHLSQSDGVLIPAYVLVPKNAPIPAPAVLALHSHGHKYYTGKDQVLGFSGPDSDQSYARELVRQGYVVMVTDARLFGERLGHDQKVEKANNLPGKPLFGQVLWDDLVSVDYLMSRPEVNPGLIACVGHGWGGMRGRFLAAMDPRIRAVVSSGFSSFHPEESEASESPSIFPLPDMDSRRFQQIGNMEGLIALIAPRPLFWAHGSRDPEVTTDFINSTNSAVQRFYGLFDAEASFKSLIFSGTRGFPVPVRRAAFDWLGEYLLP